MPPQLPIIIIGAGVAGLTLAQSLHELHIPFEIYERDTHISRVAGWGLTIHWALPALKSCLPPPLYQRLEEIQCDPQQGVKDTGRFLFLDLKTAEPRYVIPPSPRLRINRLKLRDLLVEGLDVRWGMAIAGFEVWEEGVRVRFDDGTVTRGSLLVGADGSGSRTRRFLVGEEVGRLNQLPVRLIGVTLRLTPEEVKPLRDIDPLLFQGCHPDTGDYLWYSILSTPEVNGSMGGDEYYEGQLNLSWIVKSPEDEVPTSNNDKIAKMKRMASNFEPRLRKVIQEIPEDSEALEIKLQDWPTRDWKSPGGRVTLIGDAAHAMTMYRGEAANHAITDAARLSEQIAAIHAGKITQKQGVEAFEAEMRSRGHDAALLSRQACFDAHDINNLTPDSPCISKRAKIPTSGIAVEG